MDRKKHLLARINPGTQHGLEIGALCNPIVPPGAGHIEYVDHLPTEELRKKYATDPNVDVARIVTVNYVWGECTLPEVVGDRRFDYVIASHVVEHVPDPIGWLREIAAVLSPGGMLSLAIPDKRWTFDCRREVTSVSEMIESYFEHRRRPTIRHCVEQFGEAAKVPGAVSAADLWQGKVSFDQIPLMTPGLLEHLGEAGMRSYFDAFRSGTYLDAHCSVFTPFSFVRILAVLARLRLLDYRVAYFQQTCVNDIEFFVTLEKLPATLAAAAQVESIIQSLPDLPAPLLDGEVRALLVAHLATEGVPGSEDSPAQDGTPITDDSQTLARMARQFTLAEAGRRKAEADVNRLLASTSWRITALLRAVKRLVSRKA